MEHIKIKLMIVEGKKLLKICGFYDAIFFMKFATKIQTICVAWHVTTINVIFLVRWNKNLYFFSVKRENICSYFKLYYFLLLLLSKSSGFDGTYSFHYDTNDFPRNSFTTQK